MRAVLKFECPLIHPTLVYKEAHWNLSVSGPGTAFDAGSLTHNITHDFAPRQYISGHRGT